MTASHIFDFLFPSALDDGRRLVLVSLSTTQSEAHIILCQKSWIAMKSSIYQHVMNRLRPCMGQKMLLVGATALFLGMMALLRQVAGSSSPLMLSLSSTNDKQTRQKRPYRMANLTTLASQFENCTVSKPPVTATKTKNWTTKPLFLAGYPSSLEGQGDLAKPLIRLLTGLNGGSKNYHAANKRLKRCQSSTDQTATCSSVHPIVGVAPERLTHLFAPTVLVALRNIRTVFPLFVSIKGNLYHGLKGQIPENDWRQQRDALLTTVLDEWKRVVTTWKSYDYYHIGMYLPYEYLVDFDKGPALIERLGAVLQSEGFEVVAPSDADAASCIWYQSIQGAAAFEQDYLQYEFGYTVEQRDLMLDKIQEMMSEEADDTELLAILKDYYADIRDFTRIDTPWIDPAK